MIQKIRINDGTQKLLQNVSTNAFVDKKLNNKELESLKNMIYNSYINVDIGSNDPNKKSQAAQSLKDQAVEFLNKINDCSKGFFGGKISPKELNEIKNLASTMQGNPLVQQICENLDISLSTSNTKENYNFGKHKASDFDPASFDFKPDYMMCQAKQNTGLDSSGGDCGPSSSSMILRKFGFLDGKSDSECIKMVREECDVTSQRNGGKWAIDESEVRTAISGLSGGQIKQKDSISIKGKTADQEDAAKVTEFIKNQLNSKREVILETGSPFSTEGNGRHYMVIDHVRDDGILMVADPALGKIVPYSQEDLIRFMNKTSSSTEIMAFGKN